MVYLITRDRIRSPSSRIRYGDLTVLLLPLAIMANNRVANDYAAKVEIHRVVYDSAHKVYRVWDGGDYTEVCVL